MTRPRDIAQKFKEKLLTGRELKDSDVEKIISQQYNFPNH